MDPAFADIMGETITLMREAFGTENLATLPISGTGSAGMEAMVANFVDPGDRVVCGVNGLFGERMADELARAGADVVQVKAEWGRAVPAEQLIEAADGGDHGARWSSCTARRRPASRSRSRASPTPAASTTRCCSSTASRRSAAIRCASTRPASTRRSRARRSA